MVDVIVVGGGIAGLTAAWKVREKGFSVRVLEANPQAGGNIRTVARDGYRMEVGPHSFMGSSEYVWRLTEQLGLEDDVEPARAASKNRYIFRDGQLYPLPLGIGSFLRTPLLSLRAKLRLGMEPFIRGRAGEADTAWEFFCRRFGQEAATYIMSPFVSGIYAGDVKLLGARAAFTKFWQFERDSGSMILGAVKYMRAKRKRLAREGVTPRRGLFSFQGGLGRITTRLSDTLGDSVITGAEVTAVERNNEGFTVRSGERSWSSRAVISAVPPQRAALLLDPLVPGIRQPLNDIPMAPVALIHWSPDADQDGFPEGFGFLMPRLYDLRVLGTIFASQLFSGRAPEGRSLFSSFYGGMHDPRAMELDDGQLADLVRQEHTRIFGLELDSLRVLRILRYSGAIPQLLPDHPEKIAEVTRQTGQVPGLFLAGNYLSGVGIEHAVESGFRAAGRTLDFLGTTAEEKGK